MTIGSVGRFADRKGLQEVIETRDGKAAGSTSTKTTYLINNDVASNLSGNKKARKLEIPILSGEDFLKLLEQE